MDISQIVKNELYGLLKQSQDSIDHLSDIVTLFQEILTRRQEEQEKLAGAIQALEDKNQAILFPPGRDILSLILLEENDD